MADLTATASAKPSSTDSRSPAGTSSPHTPDGYRPSFPAINPGVTKQAARKRFVPKIPGEAPEIDANGGTLRALPRTPARMLP